jgi:excinuclease ABC subunit A
VGLDYLTLGQSALTLSGGEAQRVKLAKELSRPSTGQTLYLLDEPTTGLHFEDIRKLLEVLDRLVDEGNTVVVIEHNLEVIKHADHVIDLGPDGGEAGGEVVVCGTPEEVAGCAASFTGQALRGDLDPDRAVAVAASKQAPTLIDDPAERWHRLQLAFSQERDAEWRGDDLTELIRLLQGLSQEVAPPDWRNPQHITLSLSDSRRWWARIRTSRPESLRLIVRTRAGAFGERLLVARAGLTPWVELDPPRERHGPRVSLKRREREDEVWFELVEPQEFEQPGFRALLAELLERFLETVR